MKTYKYKGCTIKETPEGKFIATDDTGVSSGECDSLRQAKIWLDITLLDFDDEEPELQPEVFTYYISFIDSYDGYDDYEYVTAVSKQDALSYIRKKYPGAKVIDCYKV